MHICENLRFIMHNTRTFLKLVVFLYIKKQVRCACINRKLTVYKFPCVIDDLALVNIAFKFLVISFCGNF